MIEFAAFLVTISQLLCVRNGKALWSWVLCLIACVLWGVVAYQGGLAWLGVQQILIAGIAIDAIRKETRLTWSRPRA